MGRNKYYQYFVEGDDDKKIVDTLKTEMQLIIPGKVQKFNVVEKLLNNNHIMSLKEGTHVVLVFDIDTDNVEILKQNIRFLNTQKTVKEVICVMQVQNLEDELVRCCNIRQIKELTKSKSNKDFKTDVLHISNLEKRLKECGFDFSKLWVSVPGNVYKGIEHSAHKIKKKQKKGGRNS